MGSFGFDDRWTGLGPALEWVLAPCGGPMDGLAPALERFLSCAEGRWTGLAGAEMGGECGALDAPPSS